MSNTDMKKRESNSLVQQAKPARRKYDEEFKQQALMMVRNGQSVRSVAEALGVSENLIHQRKRADRANQSTAELEVEQLRQRLKQVEMERDILKKALSIFSRQT
jgi:transposase